MKLVKESVIILMDGIYSGIPFCCVLFFIRKNFKSKQIALDVRKERSAQAGLSSEYVVRYVQCNKCFKQQQVVKIKSNGSLYGILSSKYRKMFKIKPNRDHVTLVWNPKTKLYNVKFNK